MGALTRRLSVAVVATVLNEAATVGELLASLEGQTRRPDEVVLVDGGSTDGTWQALRRAAAGDPRLRVLRERCNISRGRNLAIAASTAEVVAVTDAGVRLPPHWLEELLRPFAAGCPPDVVGGFFHADARTTFEVALGATTLPLAEEIDPERFLPSSRSVALRRTAWERVGGYPEWLDYCEDLVFDLQLRCAGHRFTFNPRASVYFRPRSTWRAFFLQYYRYARGDAKARLWPLRHLARYAAYLAGPAVLAAALHAARQRRWQQATLCALALFTAGGGYLRRPVRRFAVHSCHWPPRRRLAGLLLLPLLRAWGDLAKMCGYPVGIAWRWRSVRGATSSTTDYDALPTTR